ncbi:MAG: hypothetical protein KDI82_00390 [Gammaproteobacteria bacterium]|nr:hypothetical protein [Gammaproteobacteria bacterium]
MQGNWLRIPLAFVCAATTLVGAAEETTASLKGEALQETYREQAPVSGQVVAGIALAGFGPGSNPVSLVVPQALAGKSVCVRVLSRDGRYWSQNTFDLPRQISTAVVELDYPSEYSEYLGSLTPDQLAIRVEGGECGQEQVLSPLLAGAPRSSATGEKKELLVFVNAARADTYLVASDGRVPPNRKRCELIEEGRRTSFDTICTIELGVFEPLPESLSIRLLRRRYERAFPPTEFSVALPEAN